MVSSFFPNEIVELGPPTYSDSYCVPTKNKALALYLGDSESKDEFPILRLFTVQ